MNLEFVFEKQLMGMTNTRGAKHINVPFSSLADSGIPVKEMLYAMSKHARREMCLTGMRNAIRREANVQSKLTNGIK